MELAIFCSSIVLPVRGGDDEAALALADGRDQVDDARVRSSVLPLPRFELQPLVGCSGVRFSNSTLLRRSPENRS
jgi:hypothetical protein